MIPAGTFQNCIMINAILTHEYIDRQVFGLTLFYTGYFYTLFYTGRGIYVTPPLM